MKNKKIQVDLIILLGLFFLWLSLSLYSIFSSDLGFTVLSYNIADTPPAERLASNNKIDFDFIAHDNYLGIISINFKPVEKAIKGRLNFILKEADQDKIVYENSFDSRSFYELPFFPVGFPVINNSKNKRYQVEIKFVSKEKNGNLTLERGRKTFVAGYQYPKKDLLNNKNNLLSHSLKKTSYLLSNSPFIFLSFIYFLPFIFYVLWLFGPKNTRWYSFFIILAVLFCDILFINTIDNFVILVLLLLWHYISKQNNIKIQGLLKLSILLLICSFGLILLKQGYASEKAAIWSYLFFSYGSIVLFIRERAKGVIYN